MSAVADIRTQQDGDVQIAVLEGEVDSSNAQEVDVRLRALLTNRAMAMIVDLTRIVYLDSAGINVMFQLGDDLRSRQQTLHLVVDPATPIARMLAITALDRAQPTHRTLDEAIAAA